ncbi:MAG TPA: type IV secretory system conjugative DNA transfer family protein [Croceibacterium sp.]
MSITEDGSSVVSSDGSSPVRSQLCLRHGLFGSTYSPPRGNGPESIPFTGGDKNSPYYAKPASAAFFTKDQLLRATSLDHGRGKIFLGRLDQKMVGIADGRHVVTLAGSGGGKSVCSLIPNLRLYEGSTLILDPKGELATATAQERADRFGQTIHVLDPWGVADVPDEMRSSFNPLDALLDGDPRNLIDDADMIADALIIPAEREQHWTDSARALVRALILWLVLASDEERGGPASITHLPHLIANVAAAVREDSNPGDAAPSLFDHMAVFRFPALPQVESVIQNQGQMMAGTSARERASILSTTRTQLAFLESPHLAEKLASSNFRLADLKRKDTTIYLCLPASRMGTHSRWLRLVINLALAELEREPMRPALPVLFVLEEFSALGHMRSLESAVAYMRGFGVKLWAVLQDITQLQRDYRKSWETFLGNAGVVQAFSVNDISTLEYLSKRIGETTLEITNKQEVSSSQSMAGETGLRREFRTQRLMNPDEIGITFAHKVGGDGNAQGGLSLVLWSGKAPMMVERVYYKDLV